MVDGFKRKLHRFQEIVYDYVAILSFTLYLFVLFGLSVAAPQYLDWLDYGIKIYVCTFLIIRFNPFRHYYEFTDLDRKIVFTAAMLLLTSTFLGAFLPDLLSHFTL